MHGTPLSGSLKEQRIQLIPYLQLHALLKCEIAGFLGIRSWWPIYGLIAFRHDPVKRQIAPCTSRCENGNLPLACSTGHTKAIYSSFVSQNTTNGHHAEVERAGRIQEKVHATSSYARAPFALDPFLDRFQAETGE